METSECLLLGNKSCVWFLVTNVPGGRLLSYLYQIAHLGDDDDEPEFSSAMPLEEGDTFFFQPRPLKNLVLVDEQESLSPIMSCQVCEDVIRKRGPPILGCNFPLLSGRLLTWPTKILLSCTSRVDGGPGRL